LIERAGAELLKQINPKHELLFFYEDGGEYLTSEQLDWYRQQIRAKSSNSA